MRGIDTEIYFNREDAGKNLYRQRTYYTLMIEQEVLASTRAEAEDAFSNSGGIDHSAITKELAENRDGVETRIVDAEYRDMDAVEYIGKVIMTEEDDAEIDILADETTTKETA
jgi:hypothetical protein